jgi:hypothetical protein
MTERAEAGPGEVAVTLHFYSKPLSEWSDEDRHVMLRKIQALFRRGRKRRPVKRRRAK